MPFLTGTNTLPVKPERLCARSVNKTDQQISTKDFDKRLLSCAFMQVKACNSSLFTSLCFSSFHKMEFY